MTNVDPQRFICSVKTIRGQYLNQVSWLLPTGGSGRSGMHFAPNVGDQVVISTSLTYPIILGCLPRLGLQDSDINNMSGGSPSEDLGNSTSIRGDFTTNPNKPSDFYPGDIVTTTDGGGIFAMFANGSALLKASPLAYIFASKFDDLVRVVARNFERFSDIGQQTIANVKGRMYEFVGWDRNFSRSKNGLYELKDIIGDVAMGEALRGEPDPSAALPAKDSRVRKYSLEDSSGSPLMVEVLDESGKVTVTVSGGSTTETQHGSGIWQAQSGGTSTITVVPGSITLDYNGASTMVLDGSHINAIHGGSAVNIDSTGVQSTHGGHFINVGPSGVSIG